jgi:hypothetical protein
VLQRNGQKTPAICGERVGERPTGSPCFLLAVHTVGNASIGSLLIFGHFPKSPQYTLGVALLGIEKTALLSFTSQNNCIEKPVLNRNLVTRSEVQLGDMKPSSAR